MMRTKQPTSLPDFRAALDKFRQSIGPKADVYAAVNGGVSGFNLRLSVYANGITNSRDGYFSVEANGWEELLAAGQAKWAEFADVFDRRRVREMALAIIAATADQGECSDAALRQANFSDGEIATLGPRATEDANHIASNGPFAIVTFGGNGAPNIIPLRAEAGKPGPEAA